MLSLTVQSLERGRAEVGQAAPIAVGAGVAAGDRQSRDGRGDIRVDLEHPARVVAGDGDRALARTIVDRGRIARIAQLELTLRSA